ncbi:MAG: ATP-binding cassette domain-containing protein [Candidatus Nanopelagicales bacterium]
MSSQSTQAAAARVDDVRLNAANAALRESITRSGIPARQLTGNSVIDALLACAQSLAIDVPDERIAAARRRRPRAVAECAHILGLTVRQVDLRTEPGWWRTNAGSMVCGYHDHWVALVPRRGKTWLVDADGTSRKIGSPDAEQLHAIAWVVCPVLPNGSVAIRDLVRLGWGGGSGRDIALVSFSMAVAALLGMLVPVLSGRIVGTLVPSDQISRIAANMAVLIAAAAASTIVVTVEVLIAQRLAARFDQRASSAMYERLFKLPARFHRDHQPGELAQRVAGIEAVSTAAASAVPALASAVSIIVGSMLVLLRLTPWIALSVMLVSAAVIALGIPLLRGVVRYSRLYTGSSLELAGDVFALLDGIAKIRVAGAESRMYSRWLVIYAQQQRFARMAGIQRIRLSLIASVPAASVALIVVVAFSVGDDQSNLGIFTSVTAAASQIAGSVTMLLVIAATLAPTLPAIGALKPLLEAQNEYSGIIAADPGELDGTVAVSNLRFSYQESVPVLKDVSIEFLPGKMTAVVGPSGSGKSTLIRLLLGLEVPDSGTITYDGRSLDTLDNAAVRRQIGVVPQGAALTTGSIMENILTGSPDLTEERAWAAAERVGLAEDIRRMPMGMRTVISDGARTLSGGQRQRIMLARVMARDPKMVVLDEATSALDNITQASVAHSLAELGATRIVVAHRLSTIRHADVIVVLDQGEVVESGTYDELIERGELFARMAARQELG